MSLFGPFRRTGSEAGQDRASVRRSRSIFICAVILAAVAAGFLVKIFAVRGQAALAAEFPGFTGQFLVATQDLEDPRFIRTVVYMIQHDAGGAMGLIVNRPLGDVPLADLLDSLGLKGKGTTGKILAHYGGPVEPERGFVLHTAEYKIDGTSIVSGSIAITSQPEIIQAIGAGTGPRRSLFTLGYSGWAPGQLENEIKAGAWIVVPADESLVFDNQYEKKWERAMARRTITL